MSNKLNFNKPIELTVHQLLSCDEEYIIPMYQRNYAWEESEITQLITDLEDVYNNEGGNYYIGTLVVFNRHDGKYEVIDGQQRFTTLTLLLILLKNNQRQYEISKKMIDWYEKVNLSFENRFKSSNTISALFNLTESKTKLSELNTDSYNSSLINGYRLLANAISKKNINIGKLTKFVLNNVIIMQIEVPQDTNLNHYFEVMNSRGEQLEKHEILKARLISILEKIPNLDERESAINALDKIWEASSNMDNYVQTCFSVNERSNIFGVNDWGQFVPENFDGLVSVLDKAKNDKTHITAMDAIFQRPEKFDNADESDLIPERFNSVINFSNFLLHVLRIITRKEISLDDNISLDDKKLLVSFEGHLSKLATDKKKIIWVKEFTFSLLKFKYLFDNYIIKREYTSTGDDWSLKRISCYQNKKNNYQVIYVNTFEDEYQNKLKMLLAAFHVSAPSQVYKHWLNAALYYLFEGGFGSDKITKENYFQYMFNIARRFIFDVFLNKDGNMDFQELIYYNEDEYYPKNCSLKGIAIEKLKYGNIQNNFIFNFLDYLIWLRNTDETTNSSQVDKSIYRQFEFTFRSSVEHFYPQHPLDGHREIDDEDLHDFGNLCLISHSKNSKLSNLPPEAKDSHFSASIQIKKIDTLKLYEMINLMNKNGGWKEEQIRQHGKEMINLLIESTKIPPVNE